MYTVYLETTIFGYLTSRPHRDPVVAGHQQVTQRWWANDRFRYALFVSPAVIEEISDGDPEAAKERRDAAAGIPVLTRANEIDALAELYFTELHLPVRARVDALHLAYAVAFGVDYLATWNMAHIANAETVRKLLRLNRKLNRETPLIVTLESLLDPRNAP
ncbi:MAG: hypothetical protein JWO31_1090 [Phycisphaerales bacterium]|nr:hypothetical protein [Phycisphaerales bacterium]